MVNGLYRWAGGRLSVGTLIACQSSIDGVVTDISTDTSVHLSVEAPYKLHDPLSI